MKFLTILPLINCNTCILLTSNPVTLATPMALVFHSCVGIESHHQWCHMSHWDKIMFWRSKKNTIYNSFYCYIHSWGITNWKAANVSLYWSYISMSTQGHSLKSYLTTKLSRLFLRKTAGYSSAPWSPMLMSVTREYSRSPVLLQTRPAQQQWLHLWHNYYSASASSHHNVMSSVDCCTRSITIIIHVIM